ncbi:hypothetical protein BDN70DRAFT_875782 [Pholiota conissans]|uniref:non-specific serine/threonine protein kinase n=1 Tax=Pholiota conissans TaxID=109636 RepID=A0A9P5Z5K8_9AGAR|nr:hypothetical protein BDN70DRAFT_875782 [Pholiota conissans]
MLSSRTKQINAYGKRNRRVIDAGEDRTPSALSKKIINIFDDIPPAPEWKSVASRMKKRENNVPPKPNGVSLKVVGLQKKKRLSPVLSPQKKKQMSRVVQLMEAEVLSQPKIAATKPKSNPQASGNATDPIVISVSPVRAPLSAVSINISGSPAVPRKSRLTTATKGSASKAKKPFSPYIDVDIIVLDDQGRTVRQERRVSRTDIEANPYNRRLKTSNPTTKPIVNVDDTDSDCQIVNLPRQPPRKATRKPIIISDDSESEEEPSVNFSKAAKAESGADSALSIPFASQKLRPTPSAILEVVVPPAPYKLPKLNFGLKSIPSAAELQAQLQRQIQTKCVLLPRINAERGESNAPRGRYPLSLSPLQKPRQLTPIRGGRQRLYEPLSTVSPTTPTDFDLSINFSDLSLGADLEGQTVLDLPAYLVPLLEECHQETCGPHNFSAFIESFPYDPILHSARENNFMDMEFRKIGEASYSEVFGIGDVVLKVIPLRDEHAKGIYVEHDDGPAPSDAKDVRKEIIVTRAMGEVYGGFVKLLKTYVVKGKYPEVLLRLWDEYNNRKGSESVRPDTFKGSQIYAIIVLPNGGPDLEAYTFQNSSRTGWRQACSLFWQVAKALAHAEHLVSFEHRDLHWGQILVKNVPTNALKAVNLNAKVKSKSNRPYMDDLSHGVQATLIDLGLSRMDAGDGSDGDKVHWTPFDDEVFMGKGDYQFDIYRMMRDLTGGNWQEFYSTTNVFWLHYLLRKIIYSKGIKPPAIARKAKMVSNPAILASSEGPFSEKECYDCLLDIENWLGGAIAEMGLATNKAGSNGKGKRKTPALLKPRIVSGPARAGEIVAYGVKKGWIGATMLS